MVEGEKTRFWIPDSARVQRAAERAARHARLRRRAAAKSTRAGQAGRRWVRRPYRPSCPVLPFQLISDPARARESIGERPADIVGHGTDARPARLRLTHFFGGGAHPAFLVDLPADRVGGQRFSSTSPPAGSSATTRHRLAAPPDGAAESGQLLHPPHERFHPLAIRVRDRDRCRQTPRERPRGRARTPRQTAGRAPRPGRGRRRAPRSPAASARGACARRSTTPVESG